MSSSSRAKWEDMQTSVMKKIKEILPSNVGSDLVESDKLPETLMKGWVRERTSQEKQDKGTFYE